MAQVRKYGFDTEFAPDGAIMRETPKKLTPEEIAAECAAAYERGKQDAVAQAERKAAAALEALADAASAVLTRLDAESAAMREEAARVALAAANKIAGEALNAFGVERAAAAIEAAMDALRHHPRLLVKLPAEDAEALNARIDEMRATHAYAGAVLVRADAALRTGEVVLDWSDGVVSLKPSEAAERIAALVETALAAPAATPS
jgi:flagellar assembly protein FliH